MTNEKGSDKPSAETKTQSSSESPMVKPAPQQAEVGTRRNRDPDQAQKKTAELAQEFRTAERWNIGTNIGLGVIGVVALFIYYGQLRQMRKATEKAAISADAAKKAATTADDTLKLAFRPRVVITDIHPQTALNDGKQLAASFEVLNSGPIAAKNFKVYRFENISKLADVSRLPYGKEPLRDYPKMLPSNKPIGFGIYGQRNLSRQEIEALGKRELVATFSVLVEYEGDFPGTHHAEACMLFTLPPKAWWTYCPWTAQMD